MSPSLGRWRLWLASIALAGIALVELLHWEVRQMRRQDQYRQLVQAGAEVRAQLEARLSSALFLSLGLVTYIESQNGVIDAGNITPWLSRMIEQDASIQNIGVAPDNRIEYLYPLAGNEEALGLYYPDLPDQWPAVRAIMETGQPVLAGPLSLVQGGTGLIYRAPVYVGEVYWGLVSTVMDASAIFRVIEQAGDNLSLNIQLYRLNEVEPEVLWGPRVDLERPQYTTVISVPGATWRLRFQHRQTDMFSWVFRLSAYGLLAVMLVLATVAIRAWLKQRWQERSLRSETDELKQSLTETMNRELRTPLMNIINALTLAVKGQGGDLPPTTRQMIEVAHRNAEHLLALVDDLVSPARFGAAVGYRLAPHRVTDLVENVIRLLSSVAEARGVTLVMGQIEPEVSCVVDEHRFEQAMSAVLSHAMDVSPAEAEVEVSVRQYGQWCEIAIRDQGTDRPDAVRRGLFLSHPAKLRDAEGAGRDLVESKRLVEGMGGTLTFVNRTNGTVYRISFPVDVAEGAPTAV